MFDEEPDGDPHGECAAEINRLQAVIEKAIHWAEHAMLMRSSQNKELLGILRGHDEVPNAEITGCKAVRVEVSVRQRKDE